MAAEDKDVSAPWASQPGWDAILEAVRDQLPSIDSDSSLSDCGEEEPFIFQRSQTLLIPDLSEELAEDPASGNDLGTWVTEAEGIPPEDLVPVGVVSEPGGRRTARTEDSASRGERDPSQLEGCGEVGSFLRVSDEIPRCMVPAGDPESVSFNTKRPQASPWGLQGEATLPYQEEDLKTKPLGATSRDPERLRALRRERRRMIEKDILQKVTWEAREPACGDQAVESDPRPEAPPKEPRDAGPVLSLQQLEDWDLDYLLQSLAAREENQGNRALRATRWAADRSQGGGLTLNVEPKGTPSSSSSQASQLQGARAGTVNPAARTPPLCLHCPSWSWALRPPVLEGLHSFILPSFHIHKAPTMPRCEPGSGTQVGTSDVASAHAPHRVLHPLSSATLPVFLEKSVLPFGFPQEGPGHTPASTSLPLKRQKSVTTVTNLWPHSGKF